MSENFLKSYAQGKHSGHADQASHASRKDRSREITNLLMPGPPGAADHALWTLLLSHRSLSRDDGFKRRSNRLVRFNSRGKMLGRWIVKVSQSLARFTLARSSPADDSGRR